MASGSRIILLGQNLFFQARVETVAEPLGYSVRQARTAADFWDCYTDGETELVLVDLEGDAATWSAVMADLGEHIAAESGKAPESLPSAPRGHGVHGTGGGPGSPANPEQGPLQRHAGEIVGEGD